MNYSEGLHHALMVDRYPFYDAVQSPLEGVDYVTCNHRTNRVLYLRYTDQLTLELIDQLVATVAAHQAEYRDSGGLIGAFAIPQGAPMAYEVWQYVIQNGVLIYDLIPYTHSPGVRLALHEWRSYQDR